MKKLLTLLCTSLLVLTLVGCKGPTGHMRSPIGILKQLALKIRHLFDKEDEIYESDLNKLTKIEVEIPSISAVDKDANK